MFIRLVTALVAGLVQVPAAEAVVAADPPVVIPALQSWTTTAERSFTFTQTSRIVVAPGSAQRLADARTFGEDLASQTGVQVPVVEGGTADLRDGDIHLAAGTGSPADQYRLEVARGVITVTAPSAIAIFHGTRTILQMLRQSTTVPPGVAVDRPVYRERGVLIANAEKQFQLAWWKSLIREMSYVKMNMLWIYVGNRETPLDVMQAVNQYGKRYYVTVIPHYNMPGHFDKELFKRPDLALPGRAGDLDLSKDDAYTFTRDLVTPLLPAFDTPFWHMGSDEFLAGARYEDYPQLLNYARSHYGPNAVAPDVHYGFINFINGIVRNNGKTLRIWNDGIKPEATVPVDKNVVIEHWVGHGKSAAQLLQEGYQLHNANLDFLYHDLGVRHVDPRKIYEQFRPGLFSGSAVADDPNRILGAKLHVWTLPDAETPDEVIDGLHAPMRSLAQILWGSPKPASSYAGFESRIQSLGWAPGNWVRVSAQARQTVVAPGDQFRVTSRLRCTAPRPLTGQLTVTAPTGWTVDRTSAPLPSCHSDTIDRAVPVPVKVTVPSTAPPGNYVVKFAGPDVVEEVPIVVATRSPKPYDDLIREAGPAGYWRMADRIGTTMTDASGNNRTGQYRGAVTRNLPGPSATSRAVGLAGGYAEVLSTGLSPTGPFTVEGWFKLDDVLGGDGQAIFEKYDVPGLNGFALRLNGFGRLKAYLNGGQRTETYLYGATPVSVGVWHHIALVFDGASLATYLDGKLDIRTTTPLRPTAGSSSLKLGARGDDANVRLAGRLDDVAFYHRALTESELATHYVTAKPLDEPYVDTVLGSEPTGYWRLGEHGVSSGSASGRIGGPHLGSLTSDVPGIVPGDGALRFADGFVEVGSYVIASPTGPFSLEAWVRPTALRPDPGQAIIEKYDAPGRNGFAFRLTGDGRLWASTIGAQTQAAAVGATQLTPYAWHHVAAVFDGSRLTVYLDGQQDGQVATTIAPTPGVSSIKIGARGDDAAQRWQGDLDEVAMYRRALTPSEVLTHFQVGASE